LGAPPQASSAHLRQPHAVGEAKDSREAQRRVLAEAEPARHRRHLRSNTLLEPTAQYTRQPARKATHVAFISNQPTESVAWLEAFAGARGPSVLAPQLLDGCHGGDEDGGLADDGGVEALHGALHARTVQIIPEEHGACDKQRARQQSQLGGAGRVKRAAFHTRGYSRRCQRAPWLWAPPPRPCTCPHIVPPAQESKRPRATSTYTYDPHQTHRLDVRVWGRASSRWCSRVARPLPHPSKAISLAFLYGAARQRPGDAAASRSAARTSMSDVHFTSTVCL